MPLRTQPISAQFSQAAAQYDQHAPIQQRVAKDLWAWTKQQLPQQFTPSSCIDVGCGTGFLTQHLLAAYPHTPMHAVDIAQGMLTMVKNKHSSPCLHTHCLDGATLNAEQLQPLSPCLLVSSMCAQWFDDLHNGLHHWLKVADTVAFSVLLHPSFEVWRQAHVFAQQPCGLRNFPTHINILRDLEQLKGEGLIGKLQHVQHSYVERHLDGLSFARSLRAIGAQTPHPEHHPANLRPVLAQLRHGCELDYQLGFYYIERS